MNQADIKMQVYLLGEAFPDKFIFVMIFDKDSEHGYSRTDIICNPKCDKEHHIMRCLISAINRGPSEEVLEGGELT